jgi:hypothetical protein
MKIRKTRSLRRLLLKITFFSHYTDQIYQLEKAVARKPAKLQIEMIGSGEIPPDAALLMRSILLKRSAQTQLITNARSSLQNASVLVWLLGDTRQIREDAKLCFKRAANQDEECWKDEEESCDLFPDGDLEEADYAQVLQYINEYLPVKELAGKPIDLQVLKQFALVDNEKRDQFLASAFASTETPAEMPPQQKEQKSAEQESKVPHPDQSKSE